MRVGERDREREKDREKDGERGVGMRERMVEMPLFTYRKRKREN